MLWIFVSEFLNIKEESKMFFIDRELKSWHIIVSVVITVLVVVPWFIGIYRIISYLVKYFG